MTQYFALLLIDWVYTRYFRARACPRGTLWTFFFLCHFLRGKPIFWHRLFVLHLPVLGRKTEHCVRNRQGKPLSGRIHFLPNFLSQLYETQALQWMRAEGDLMTVSGQGGNDGQTSTLLLVCRLTSLPGEHVLMTAHPAPSCLLSHHRPGMHRRNGCSSLQSLGETIDLWIVQNKRALEESRKSSGLWIRPWFQAWEVNASSETLGKPLSLNFLNFETRDWVGNLNDPFYSIWFCETQNNSEVKHDEVCLKIEGFMEHPRYYLFGDYYFSDQ